MSLSVATARAGSIRGASDFLKVCFHDFAVYTHNRILAHGILWMLSGAHTPRAPERLPRPRGFFLLECG